MESGRTASVCSPPQEKKSMQGLKLLINMQPNPVFLTNKSDGTILLANDTVSALYPERSLENVPVSNILCYEEQISEACNMVYFDEEWLVCEKQTFAWEDLSLEMIMLSPCPGLPSMKEIHTARDMVGLVLHRLRSPMTGMQGYLDMLMDDPMAKQIRHRVTKLSSGMDQLNDMLDELETLHTAETRHDVSSINVGSVAMDYIKSLDKKTQKRIEIRQHSRGQAISSSRQKIEKLFQLLITNALEHTAGKRKPVQIILESPLKVHVTNYGDPVPEYLNERIFSPFITNKPQNMGIGLTIAYLICRQLGITIIQTSNSGKKGVTFTLLLPPRGMS
ncbi:sensor histidine kinase [Natronogracilivirga saccharolytica]|uniref:histidine kinase n=1 Tax=Natronogracilivirga saccharolytica TaxID=2812953 RepID=A0A8J7RLL1_9BACT|nr:HAMP domain-containing sensor histidine kinase [Natronogracilivirga saccharolytica]MBP3191929.1 HAMP domain-containing histidine kinase [Natronogracilivirga saccharolytica]